jgi:acetyl esterase/lipase
VQCAPIIAAPSYRLATVTENLFPAALQDLFSVYHHLISQGFIAENITIAGDSAFGNLGTCFFHSYSYSHLDASHPALVLTYIISQSDLSMPGRVVVFSPDADLTHASSTSMTHELFPLSIYHTCSSQYLGGFSADSPLALGAFIPFNASWPKTLVMTGTADNVAESSRRVASGIKEAGGEVELVKYADLTHGWWMLAHIFPMESDDGLKRLAAFVCS